MIRIVLMGIALAVATTAAAQQIPDDPPERGRDGEARRSQPYRGLKLELTRNLQLDEEQRARLDVILAAQSERADSMRQRWQELRQAIRERDRERIAELRAQVQKQRGRGMSMLVILDALEPVLHEDQLDRFDEIRAQSERNEAALDFHWRLTTELPDDLGLDDAQRKEFTRLLAEQHERMRPEFELLRPLIEGQRAALEAGDEERVAELEQAIKESRPKQGALLEGFFDRLEQILNEEQREILADFRAQQPTVEKAAAGANDVRYVLRAAKRSRLSTNQKQQLREIERAALQERRDLGRRDEEGQARLATEVRGRIVKLLDPEQVERFEARLARLERRNRR